MKKGILILLLFIGKLIAAQTGQCALVPLPNSIEKKDGTFVLSDTTTLVASEGSFEAEFLKEYLEKNYGIHVKVDAHNPPFANYISLTSSPGDLSEVNPEAYLLQIGKEGIAIGAYGNEGLFYGIQTLIQLLPVEKNNRLLIPCMQIADAPAFKWRGMHLDCCRHFFTKEEVKKYIDYLAMYKINTFHWHLTDDQGWRIEIKKYPLLSTISSQRKQTLVGKPSKDPKNDKYDGKTYGGSYTQEDIKEIVAYAAQRHITIVPEIEMPGHSLAALAAYPQYSCTGGPFETYTTWGVSDDVFCAGNDSTYAFIENVLDEVMQLFPGKYIHIGGDECPKECWKVCPKCRARMKTEKLEDVNQLQSYFITRVEKYVNSKGRQIIGWDEILEGGLAPNAAVMSWRGTEGGIAAAKQNHFVVMTPGKPCYFDHYQTKDRSGEPMAIGGFNPLDSVYNYSPVPGSLSAGEQKYILGAQGNVWTEYITSFSQVEYMSVPRMCALSEVLWTKPENKNFKDFNARLKMHSKVLDRMNVKYAKHFITKK